LREADEEIRRLKQKLKEQEKEKTAQMGETLKMKEEVQKLRQQHEQEKKSLNNELDDLRGKLHLEALNGQTLQAVNKDLRRGLSQLSRTSFRGSSNSNIDAPDMPVSTFSTQERATKAMNSETLVNSDSNSGGSGSSSSIGGTGEKESLFYPPLWVPDSYVERCRICTKAFTVIRRKHHCRQCGNVFCNNCSNHFVYLPHLLPFLIEGERYPELRVCDFCFHFVKHETSQADGDWDEF